MKYVGKAIWIQQVLRVVSAPDVAGPQKKLSAGAPPGAALISQQRRGNDENCNNSEPRPWFSM